MITVIISNVGSDDAGWELANKIVDELNQMVRRSGTLEVDFAFKPEINGGEIVAETDFSPTNIWKDVMRHVAKDALTSRT